MPAPMARHARPARTGFMMANSLCQVTERGMQVQAALRGENKTTAAQIAASQWCGPVPEHLRHVPCHDDLHQPVLGT